MLVGCVRIYISSILCNEKKRMQSSGISQTKPAQKHSSLRKHWVQAKIFIRNLSVRESSQTWFHKTCWDVCAGDSSCLLSGPRSSSLERNGTRQASVARSGTFSERRQLPSNEHLPCRCCPPSPRSVAVHWVKHLRSDVRRLGQLPLSGTLAPAPFMRVAIARRDIAR
jgi:hypothetical protein